MRPYIQRRQQDDTNHEFDGVYHKVVVWPNIKQTASIFLERLRKTKQ